MLGSDGGELVKRVRESDIGLILIDEFEKADNAVFNYFLDVLESGKIVNSQAEEYDINGYIIVFTSNISEEDFRKNISPELRSRFDYKGRFNLLTNEDKFKFVHFRVNQIVDKYIKFVSADLPEKLHDEVVNSIDVTQYEEKVSYKNAADRCVYVFDVFARGIGLYPHVKNPAFHAGMLLSFGESKKSKFAEPLIKKLKKMVKGLIVQCKKA